MMDDQCDTKRHEMSSSDLTSIKTEPVSDTSHQYANATNEEPTEPQPETINSAVGLNDSTVPVSVYNHMSNSDGHRHDHCSIMMSVKEECIDTKYSDDVSTTRMEINREQRHTTQDDPSINEHCHFTRLNLDIKRDITHLIKSNVCSRCDMSFDLIDRLKIHKITCTGENPKPGSQCDNSCNQTHRPRRTPVRDQQYSSQCDTSCLKRANSRRITNTRRKKHYCYLCNKTLSNSVHLRRNMIIHNGEQSYSCPQCDKSFNQTSSVNTHMTHSEEKTYSCSPCDKSSRHSINRNIHKLIHTEEKPHSCHWCEETYEDSYWRKPIFLFSV